MGASKTKTASGALKLGQAVRYRGLGTGQVVRFEERDWQGETADFAVIYFPHRQMSVQVAVEQAHLKLSAADSSREVKRLLKTLPERGKRLLRTWDERERQGFRRLRQGGPQEWVELLRDYATAARSGMAVTSSDADLVREATELLAGELACVENITFEVAFGQVSTAYAKAMKKTVAAAA